jgi:hypothetical protein
MEANRKRNIQSGERYTHLFPEAANSTSTIRKDANVYHTVAFIPKVVNETLFQTKKIAEQLKANTLNETCSNIWHFVYRHIAYKKDADGYEQIRSPARAWHDRFKGVDCDCYSVFISSILSNMEIPHTLRITKYNRDHFQHIYPIVPTDNGYITIDCVTDKYDYEVPFSEKKDYPMDLQYLNGFDGSSAEYAQPNDAYLLAGDGMNDLGKIIQQRFSSQKKQPSRTKSNTPMKRKTKQPGALSPSKKPKGFKKILNKVNKLNPATVMIRNGILASMKLNIKNVAGRLRWSYLSQEEAVKRGIDPMKFQKLVATRQRVENILYKSGGKPDNLRKAILNGKGNKDKAIHGLDGFDGMVEYMNEYMPIEQLLGDDIHYSENIEGMNGLGQLGEPFTLASLAAASGVIVGIVGMLKQVGDIFQKKSKASEDFDEAKNEKAENETITPPGTNPPQLPVPTQEVINTMLKEEALTPAVTNNALPAVTNNANASPTYETPVAKEKMKEDELVNDKIASKKDDGKGTEDDKVGFWDKNKKWLKPVAIGVGGISLLAIGIKLFKGHSGSTPQNKSSPKALHGTPKKKKPKKNSKSKPNKKTAVALM